MEQISRREFTRRTAAAGLAAALSSSRILGANDRIRVGFIGVGNRGDQVLDGFLAQKDADVVAICDLWQPYLDFAAKKTGTSPQQFKDYRKVLDLKDLDAVVISTPDHWHALQMIHACQAGKDVYVEKPLSLCVAEGRRMVEAAHRYKRVTQVGLMRRSGPGLKDAVNYLQGGGIGKITAIRAFHIQNEWPKGIGNPPDGDPPADFDWDAWLGPAPKVPYNPNRTFYHFRWFYDYSGGQLSNFGAHYIDFSHWLLGHDAPLAVTAMGGKYAVEDNREIPDTLEVIWSYPGNTLITFSQFDTNGAHAAARDSNMEIRGTKGTMYMDWNGYEVVPEKVTEMAYPPNSPLDRTSDEWQTSRKTLIEPRKVSDPDATPLHARNFLDCVRSRKSCNCDIETGHRSTTATLVADIALKTRTHLQWDSKTERFTNSDAANRLLNYHYRAPYKLPEV
ncbi:MAG: Gfo/Idh/MocA family oxidoreductase [Terriglobia bacterium]|jgi:predicted dehydrogenase